MGTCRLRERQLARSVCGQHGASGRRRSRRVGAKSRSGSFWPRTALHVEHDRENHGQHDETLQERQEVKDVVAPVEAKRRKVASIFSVLDCGGDESGDLDSQLAERPIRQRWRTPALQGWWYLARGAPSPAESREQYDAGALTHRFFRQTLSPRRPRRTGRSRRARSRRGSRRSSATPPGLLHAPSRVHHAAAAPVRRTGGPPVAPTTRAAATSAASARRCRSPLPPPPAPRQWRAARVAGRAAPASASAVAC
jgi:hypothetical protein